MSDQDNKPSAGLEGLLRRWGAETAMREAQVPASPSIGKMPLQVPDEKAEPSTVFAESPSEDQSQSGGPEPSPETPEEVGVAPAWAPAEAGQPKPGLIRTHWLSVVAGVAAALLLMGAALFFYWQGKSRPGGQASKTVIAERDQARKHLQEAVEIAGVELADQKDKYDRILAKTARDHEALRESLGVKEIELEALKTEAAKGASLLAKMGPRLRDATEEIKKKRELLAYKEREAADLVRLVDGERKKIGAAQEELDRLIKTNEQAARASREERNRMVLMGVRREALFVDARRIYLSAKAPNAAGLHASQLAARSSDMVEQCAKLRERADADALRILVDKLEFFLTRLDLIDAASYEEAGAFATLVGTSKIVDQVDEALGARIDDEDFRMWLFEARLILMGTERAG